MLIRFCCRYLRRKRYNEKDWRITHYKAMELCANRERVEFDFGPPHDQHTFNEYLQWLHMSTRTHIRGPYIEEGVEEDSETT
jgi:hypothetical protein